MNQFHGQKVVVPPPPSKPSPGAPPPQPPVPERQLELPVKVRIKVEPVPEGRLEQLLIEYKRAAEQAAEGKERAEELKARIKGFLLDVPEGTQLPDGFDVPADAHGRYPGFSLTMKTGWRLDTDALKEGDPATYIKYAVKSKPTWELREKQVRGRR